MYILEPLLLVHYLGPTVCWCGCKLAPLDHMDHMVVCCFVYCTSIDTTQKVRGLHQALRHEGVWGEWMYRPSFSF
jgi:hypothetical protein